MLKKQAVVGFMTKSVSEEGVIRGVLNHFGNKDHANDVTVKGAFTKTLMAIKESGRDLVVLWQHDHTKPIGIWKNLRETSRGLEGEAHLNMDVELAREAFSLAKQGAVTGFSIGYYVIDEEFDRKTNTNYLKEVHLLETSLVTFPCNELSRTEGVKMKLKNNQLPTAAELKSILVGVGFSDVEAGLITEKYMPDHVDPEEMKRQREAAEAEVKTLIEKFGLKYVVDTEADVQTTEEVKEDEESEPEEKTETEDKTEEVEEETEVKTEEENDETEGEKSLPIDSFWK